MSLRTLKRRRLEKKTDYKSRIGMLKSKTPRIAIRKTNKYLIVQLIESKEAQDKIITGVTSKDLLENGWNEKFKGSLKSTPAAYLTGLLMAKKIGKGKFILDIGMAKNVKGSRIYAVAKGLVDGGLNINVNKSVYPSEERINGEHLKEEVKAMIKKVREKIK